MKKKIKEDYRHLTQNIDVEDENVKAQINSLLSQALSEPFMTPYMSLERINKVLTVFHIFIPSATFLDGDHGYKVFEVSQFGRKFGMTDDGEVKVKNGSENSIFLEYGMNDDGMFDVFCEIVNAEELQEILDDIEDEEEDIQEQYPIEKKDLKKRAKYGLKRASKGLENPVPNLIGAKNASKFAVRVDKTKDTKEKAKEMAGKVKTIMKANVNKAKLERLANKGLEGPNDKPKDTPRPFTPEKAKTKAKVVKRKVVVEPSAEVKSRPTPHLDKTDRFNTSWNQSIKTVGEPHLKNSENNHYHPENMRKMRDHVQADVHSMMHGKTLHSDRDINNFKYKAGNLIRDAIHHWTKHAKYDDIENEMVKGNVNPDPVVLDHMHTKAKVEYGLDGDKTKHDNRIEKINRMSTLVHGTKKGWFGKVTPNVVFKEEHDGIIRDNVKTILEAMNKQYRKK